MSIEAPDRPRLETEPSHATTGVSRLAIVLFPLRVFLALGWMRAAASKVIDVTWWRGDYLRAFLVEHREAMLPFATPVAAIIDSPIAIGVALVVLVAQVAVAGCLLTGRYLRPSLWVACAMNVSFVVFGAVNPSAFYLIMQLTLLLAGSTMRTPSQPPRAVAAIAGWVLVAAALLPFVRTLHPAAVIDDPALMLATLAGLRAATITVLAVEHRWPRSRS